MITTINTKKKPHPAGRRYNRDQWPPLVREMWAQGLTYIEMGKRLGVSTTTACRWSWQLGLSNHKVHRNTTKKAQRAALIKPEVMSYQAIEAPLTKREDDIRRGLRRKEGSAK